MEELSRASSSDPFEGARLIEAYIRSESILENDLHESSDGVRDIGAIAAELALSSRKEGADAMSAKPWSVSSRESSFSPVVASLRSSAPVPASADLGISSDFSSCGGKISSISLLVLLWYSGETTGGVIYSGIAGAYLRAFVLACFVYPLHLCLANLV